MNYPVWELTTIGGGSLIALISILHVYISHLAVGGGIFIWLTDRKGVLEKNAELTAYVKRHTWFFLLVTMVFGGVSGVGIWFIIALVNPAATSQLIHLFVFGWATEWVFFVCEILALLLYHYKFDTLSEKSRLSLAFFYALFAWLSLFVINGILSFMLTPGQWLQTGSFWSAFFNPTFLPSLFFRTFIALIIAGLFGYVTAVFIKENHFRNLMMRYSSKWLLYPVPFLLASGWWYYFSIPQAVRHTNFVLNPQTSILINLFIFLTLVLFVGALFLSFKMSRGMQRFSAFLLILIGLIWMGGFEYSREIARKPFVIRDYMYSNSVLKTDVAKLNKNGFLANSKWSSVKQLTASNQLQAGKELFNLQCLSCHTINGIRNDIIPLTKNFTRLGLLSQLTGQGKVHNYMPPFMGTEQEKEALALFIYSELQHKEDVAKPALPAVERSTAEIPPFDAAKAEYVLLAWNDMGMHPLTDSDPYFVFAPPANTLEAQLILRGEVPELVMEGVRISYRVESGFENPSAHVQFWDFAESSFGKKLPANVGLKGNGLQGELKFSEERNGYIAAAIPVVPYKDDSTFNAYPVFNIEARDSESGKLLAATQVVAPVSSKVGCLNCHEGGWRVDNLAGIDAQTSSNILALHDRYQKTDLLKQAVEGKPKLCQSCHANVMLGRTGQPGVLNFSAAMHGWHAQFMPYSDARACASCHPAQARGNRGCFRGIHNSAGLSCVDCHGGMQEHSIALLKAESGKNAAADLLRSLQPESVAYDDIHPRMPWLQEPDCLTCHQDFEQPQPNASAFNVWNEEPEELFRLSSANAGVRCQGCHGTTHALYPAQNPDQQGRDNIQPLQYSGLPLPLGSNFGCSVCHTIKMEDSVHHENMERPFRNTNLVP